jgi:hypothetical protein
LLSLKTAAAAAAAAAAVLGCILADDMGLGKTLQGISLMWTLLQQGSPALGGRPIAKVGRDCCLNVASLSDFAAPGNPQQKTCAPAMLTLM